MSINKIVFKRYEGIPLKKLVKASVAMISNVSDYTNIGK